MNAMQGGGYEIRDVWQVNQAKVKNALAHLSLPPSSPTHPPTCSLTHPHTPARALARALARPLAHSLA